MKWLSRLVRRGSQPPSGPRPRNRNAYCSFCRKSYKEVGPLVEGPGDVYICGSCVTLCNSIIEEERARRAANPPADTSK